MRGLARKWELLYLDTRGFEQLAIILEQNKDYDGAVRLSEEALRQGWAGDWGKCIDRCRQRSKQ